MSDLDERMRPMFGTSLSWDRYEGQLVIETADGNLRGPIGAEEELVDRVAALSEAAQRSMLALRTLPMALEECDTPEQAAQVLQTTLYEAESALHFVLNGE